MKRESKVSIRAYLNTKLKSKNGRYPVYFAVIYKRVMTRICTEKYMTQDELDKADLSYEISQVEESVRNNGLKGYSKIKRNKKATKKNSEIITQFSDEILKKEVLRRYNFDIDIKEEQRKEEWLNKSEEEIREMMMEIQENLNQQIILKKRYRLLNRAINVYMKHI